MERQQAIQYFKHLNQNGSVQFTESGPSQLCIESRDGFEMEKLDEAISALTGRIVGSRYEARSRPDGKLAAVLIPCTLYHPIHFQHVAMGHELVDELRTALKEAHVPVDRYRPYTRLGETATETLSHRFMDDLKERPLSISIKTNPKTQQLELTIRDPALKMGAAGTEARFAYYTESLMGVMNTAGKDNGLRTVVMKRDATRGCVIISNSMNHKRTRIPQEADAVRYLATLFADYGINYPGSSKYRSKEIP